MNPTARVQLKTNGELRYIEIFFDSDAAGYLNVMPQTVAADLAIVTILAYARMRANASRTLGRQAAEPDVSWT